MIQHAVSGTDLADLSFKIFSFFIMENSRVYCVSFVHNIFECHCWVKHILLIVSVCSLSFIFGIKLPYVS